MYILYIILYLYVYSFGKLGKPSDAIKLQIKINSLQNKFTNHNNNTKNNNKYDNIAYMDSLISALISNVSSSQIIMIENPMSELLYIYK